MKKDNSKFLKINPINRYRKETIIMFHGWGSTVDSQVELGETFSKIGFKVIIPEIKYHDKRNALNNHFQEGIVQTYFWKTIFESIDERTELLDSLDLDVKNTILFGSSMGGFIASGMYFLNQEFAGLININGSSSFVASEVFYRKRDNREPLNDGELHTFKLYDPKYKSFQNDNPILLMHGESDQIVPIIGQADFISSYENQNRKINFLKYKDVNHTITNNMKNDLLNWLDKNFKKNLNIERILLDER